MNILEGDMYEKCLLLTMRLLLLSVSVYHAYQSKQFFWVSFFIGRFLYQPTIFMVVIVFEMKLIDSLKYTNCDSGNFRRS